MSVEAMKHTKSNDDRENGKVCFFVRHLHLKINSGMFIAR